MFLKLLTAGFVMALCVTVHAFVLTAALRWTKRRHTMVAWEFWPSVHVLIILACGIVALHLVEISLWAFLYRWTEALPDLPSAFYFSVVTYTTTGYGDLVLPKSWRLVGGVEALTGILMCGWSTGFFFAIVSRMYADTPQEHRPDTSSLRANHGRPPQ